MGLVGVLMGLSPIAGHHFGARKFRAIGEELNQSFWLSLVLMAVGVPLLLNTDFWIELGGAKGEVAEMAAEFIRWTAFALPASLLGRCFIALNAAVSRPRITMWVSLGMLALKAPLNAVFMYGWLAFPRWAGAAPGFPFSFSPGSRFLPSLRSGSSTSSTVRCTSSSSSGPVGSF